MKISLHHSRWCNSGKIIVKNDSMSFSRTIMDGSRKWLERMKPCGNTENNLTHHIRHNFEMRISLEEKLGRIGMMNMVSDTISSCVIVKTARISSLSTRVSIRSNSQPQIDEENLWKIIPERRYGIILWQRSKKIKIPRDFSEIEISKRGNISSGERRFSDFSMHNSMQVKSRAMRISSEIFILLNSPISRIWVIWVSIPVLYFVSISSTIIQSLITRHGSSEDMHSPKTLMMLLVLFGERWEIKVPIMIQTSTALFESKIEYNGRTLMLDMLHEIVLTQYEMIQIRPPLPSHAKDDARWEYCSENYTKLQ